MRLASSGSSPYVSSRRPQRASRAMSRTGASVEPGADGSELAADHFGHLFDQRRIPGRGEVDALRKLRRLTGAEPTRGLLVDHRRNPQSRLLDEIALDLVPQLSDPPRRRTRLNGDPADLADPVCGCQGEPVQGELAVDEQAREPHAAELRALLLQCHARHEFVNVSHRLPSRLGGRRLEQCSMPSRGRQALHPAQSPSRALQGERVIACGPAPAVIQVSRLMRVNSSPVVSRGLRVRRGVAALRVVGGCRVPRVLRRRTTGSLGCMRRRRGQEWAEVGTRPRNPTVTCSVRPRADGLRSALTKPAPDQLPTR